MVEIDSRSFYSFDNFCIYESRSDRVNYKKQKNANLKELD
jgi:hypothetical protein